jgi:hypothetical protein
VSAANRILFFCDQFTAGKLSVAYLSVTLGNTQIYSDAVFPTGVWKHVAYRLGSKGIDLWIDGRLQADRSAITTKTIAALVAAHGATTSNNVMSDVGGSYWMGKLALPSIVDVALDEADIKELFNRERHLFGV